MTQQGVDQEQMMALQSEWLANRDSGLSLEQIKDYMRRAEALGESSGQHITLVHVENWQPAEELASA